MEGGSGEQVGDELVCVTSSVKQNKITGGECVGVLPFDGEIKMYIITDIT